MHNRFLIATTVLPMLASSPMMAEPPATTAPEAPILAGPDAGPTESASKTLVERDFGGGLVRLEVRPERAAVDLLSLTAEQRKTVDAFFDARGEAVASLLFEHLDLFLELQSARQSGTIGPGADRIAQRETAPKLRELRSVAAPLIEPPLADQVAVLLPGDQTTMFRRLVSEYTAALAAEANRDAGMTEDRPKPDSTPTTTRRRPAGAENGEPRAGMGSEFERRYEFSQLLREMARSLSAVVDARREQTAELLATVQATPEQAERIQRILRESSDTPGKPANAEQRAATARRIMDVLSPEQRQLLRESRQPKPS